MRRARDGARTRPEAMFENFDERAENYPFFNPAGDAHNDSIASNDGQDGSGRQPSTGSMICFQNFQKRRTPC